MIAIALFLSAAPALAKDIYIAPYEFRIMDPNGNDYTFLHDLAPSFPSPGVVQFDDTDTTGYYLESVSVTFPLYFIEGYTLHSFDICYAVPDMVGDPYKDQGILETRLVEIGAPGTAVTLFENKRTQNSPVPVCEKVKVAVTPTAPLFLQLEIKGDYRWPVQISGFVLHVHK